jgi:KAP family P-loop domain
MCGRDGFSVQQKTEIGATGDLSQYHPRWGCARLWVYPTQRPPQACRISRGANAPPAAWPIGTRCCGIDGEDSEVWADNETELDLLGFEYLVDGLVVALTQPRLLPLTIGVLGDWGSGKSSLMRITAKEIARENPAEAPADGDGEPAAPYLTVPFSPWQYEDVEDVKVALMNTVLDALARRVPDSEERIGRLRSFGRTLKRFGRRAGRATASAAPTVVPFFVQAMAPDTDPETLKLAGTVTEAVAKQVSPLLDDPAPRPLDPAGTASENPITDVTEFRAEFKKLIEDADPAIAAVIVFVDDLDRCLPETVVDTFEAIRLFLNTPRTAYVLALNQGVVESAIDSRYPDLERDGGGIGRDYLEKMLQLKIVIPALSAPEAETYANLLFAELHLDEPTFDTVVEHAATNRAANGLSVAFNAGIAGTLLGDITADLARDLAWAANIMPVLGASLRGNPRQLKRFLNNLLLKHHAAARRGVELKLPELAKLMVLEDQYNSNFQKVFDWQMAADGPSPQLAEAEDYARDLTPVNAATQTPSEAGEKRRAGSKTAEAQPKDPAPAETVESGDNVRGWADKPFIRDWLCLDPPLKEVDLRAYFTYSRDKLSFGVTASRLAPHLQKLLNLVQDDREPTRRSHYPEVAALEPSERAQLVEALLDRVHRHPQGVALTSVIELAELNIDIVDTVCESLR